MLFERRRRRLHEKGEQGQPQPALFGLLGFGFAKRLQVGDVGFVVLSDVGNQSPRTLHALRSGAANAAQGLQLDWAELREIHRRQIGPVHAGRRCPGHRGLDVVAQIFFHDAAVAARALDLGKRHAQLTRQMPNRWRRVVLALLFVDHQRNARGGRGPRAAPSAVGHGKVVHDHPRRHGHISARQLRRRFAAVLLRRRRLGLPGTRRGGLARNRSRPGITRRSQGCLLVDRNGYQPRARRHLVAHLDQHLDDRTGVGRGDVEGSFVAFQNRDGIVALEQSPGRDQDFDDGNVVKIADIRDQHVNRLAHVPSPCAWIKRGSDPVSRDQFPV